jgi:hypothetical protein
MSNCDNYYQLPSETDSCFYEGANNNNDDCKERFTNKDCNTNDIGTTSEIIKDAIERTGIEVKYYVNTTTMSGADPIYGEQPQAMYHTPKTMTMYVELEEDAIQFTKFGIRADDTITAYVHISSYAAAFDGDDIYNDNSWYVEPKADDVFELSEYGSTRPGDRSGKLFIVTERMDSDIAAMNALGSHYVWRIRGKRLEWSFEPGLSGEGGNNQIIDNNFQGRLSGGDNPETDEKSYEGDIDTYSKDSVFDMDNIDSSPYGDYG